MMKPVLAEAEATAPVVSGELRDSLHIESGVEDGVAYARVVASTIYAARVSSGNPYLQKALDAL